MKSLRELVETATAYYRLLVPEVPSAPNDREIAKDVVRRMYRSRHTVDCGSYHSDHLLLAQGRYVTREDLERRWELVRKYGV